MSQIDDFLIEISDVVDRFPQETRWDIASAMIAEPGPFDNLVKHTIRQAILREGRIIRPLGSGIVGGMLLAGYGQGGFLYNALASVGDNKFSQPDWIGDEEQTSIIKYVILYVGYADELPAVRDAAAAEGLYIIDEVVLKSTIHLEQP